MASGRLAGLRGLSRLFSAPRLLGATPSGAPQLSRLVPAASAAAIRRLHCETATAERRLRPQWTPAARKTVLLCRNYSEEAAMSPSEIQQNVINVLKMFDKIDPDKVTPQAHFINDLGLDSLDVVEIVMAFEDEFGVEIDDEEAEKIFTANDAVGLLKVKLDAL